MTVVKTVIVEATNNDVRRFYNGYINRPWQGKAVKKGRIVLGMGGVSVFDDGTIMAFMDLTEQAKTPIVFRHVLQYLNALAKKGAEPVLAAADASVPRAEDFLTRLGFEPTESFDPDGKRIWIWQRHHS